MHSKSGDLSRALIPINDVSKLPNMPALPQAPSSLAEILNGKLKEGFSVSLAEQTTTAIEAIIGDKHTQETCNGTCLGQLFRMPGSHNDYYSNDPF